MRDDRDESPMFEKTMGEGYAFQGDSIVLGCGLLDGEAFASVKVCLPLKTVNRHGLIAGATGTGKTKTVQLLAESLSQQGVPCLLMDIKGDLSGLAMSGTMHPKITERMARMDLGWRPEAFPVEFLSLSGGKGVTLRATVSEFGPVLFSRILGLNDTQAGVVSVVFRYCDQQRLPLVDLKDFRKVLQYLTNEGKKDVEREYGRISTATTGAVIRKVVELEQQGADRFFGERSFDPDDLLRLDEHGKAYLNILRLDDLQDRPKLFSTFMLSLLAEIYATFPEQGDADKPRLVLFIDEAHLVFREASDALLGQIETIVKLIRSKGVGLVFCTQLPGDIPPAVLSQLGLKVQHALRAFTARDRKAIRTAAENYPETAFYRTDQLITSLGIGEALVTALDEKGIPTPLVHTLLRAPASRMGILTDAEIDGVAARSGLASKYNEPVDPDSAYEMLTRKMNEAGTAPAVPAARKNRTTAYDAAGRVVIRTVARELTRSLLGVLGISGTTRRNRSLF